MLGAVAIAIVNYRTPDLVGDCLDALGDLAAYAEVVVVDNASGDGSPDIIERRHPAARVVRRSDNGGFAAGVNAAFAATSAPVVVLLNPDTLPAPAAIAALADHLDVHPGCGVAAPMLEHRDGSPQPSAYRRFPGTAIMALELCAPLGFVVERIAGNRHPYRAAAAGTDRHAVPVAHVIGAVLAIRRSAYEAAGPFDEGFFLYLEETEWQRRVGRAGFTVEILPATRVVHLVRGGDGAELAPSPHFLPSAVRWMTLDGTSPRVARMVVAVALLGSRVGFRVFALTMPGRRELHLSRAHAFDALWRRRPRAGDLSGRPAAR